MTAMDERIPENTSERGKHSAAAPAVSAEIYSPGALKSVFRGAYSDRITAVRKGTRAPRLPGNVPAEDEPVSKGGSNWIPAAESPQIRIENPESGDGLEIHKMRIERECVPEWRPPRGSHARPRGVHIENRITRLQEKLQPPARSVRKRSFPLAVRTTL